MPSVTVVLPIYNEVGIVPALARSLMAWSIRQPSFHFLVVDDGSTDGTGPALVQALGQNKELRVLCLPRNVGKGEAVRLGFLTTEDEWVCFTDGDLAYAPETVESVIAGLKENDVAIGSRNLGPRQERRPELRRQILGQGFNFLVQVILGLPYLDTQAGVKAFRRPVAKRLFAHLGEPRFAFDAELLYRARHFKYRVGEYPVTVRTEHNYKTSKLKLLQDSWKMLQAIVRMRMRPVR
jgi:dolichyl-phosphate beta-glucosyltransferase